MPLTILGQAAVAYAEQLGLYLLPLWGVKDRRCLCRKRTICPATGKHPIGELVRHGKADASNDPDVIRRWWEQEPNANIGLHCGLSGLLVVDIDPRNGGNESWEGLLDQHGPPPDTQEAESGGGGRHLVFRRPTQVPVKDRKLEAGIDIKVDGYIVVAPSAHKSGQEYTWLAEADPFDGAPFADPPAWLVEKLQVKDEVSPVSTPTHELRYREGAKPPPEFWDALPTDDSLAGIWERTRRPTNQNDDTPSAWTMSLRRRLLKYRLPPQETLDTMGAYRRKHGDRHKGRQWFLNEASRYAADLESPSIQPLGDPPPPALRRHPTRVDRTRDLVEEAIKHGAEMPRRRTYERLLLIQLASYSKDGETAWPSQRRLATEAGLGVDHVSNTIGVIDRWGCIKKLGRSAPNTTIKYRFTFLDTPHEHTN